MQNRRKITNLVLTLAAVGLGLFAQSRFRTDRINDALILYLVAVVLLVYANRRRDMSIEAEGSPPTRTAISTRQLGGGPSTVSRATLRTDDTSPRKNCMA